MANYSREDYNTLLNLREEYKSKKDQYSPEQQRNITEKFNSALTALNNSNNQPQQARVIWWYQDAQGNRREEYSDGTTKMVEAAPKKEVVPTRAPRINNPIPETPAPEVPAPETQIPETPAPEVPRQQSGLDMHLWWYNWYANLKANKNSTDANYREYFKNQYWNATPNSSTVNLIRNQLSNYWLWQDQINEYIQDYSNAMLWTKINWKDSIRNRWQ